MEMCIDIITSGKHNPSLSIKMDCEAAIAFATGFIGIFGKIEKTANGGVKTIGKVH